MAQPRPLCPLRSRRWRGLALWLPLVLWSAGCSSRPQGEFSALDCGDGEDNDGDLLTDCADPDCAALAHCQRPPLGMDTDLDAGMLSPPPEADGGPCTDGCAMEPAPRYEVRVIGAEVPNYLTGPGRCADLCTQVPALLTCRCDPDPYVEIWLGQELLLTSSTVRDTLTPRFDDAVVEAEIDPRRDGDLLVLVLDDDTLPDEIPDEIPERDDELVRCRLYQEDLQERGAFTCTAPGNDRSLTLQVTALD